VTVLDNGSVDITSFTRRLHGLSANEIGTVAAALRAELDTPDGEVSWWRALSQCLSKLCGFMYYKWKRQARQDLCQPGQFFCPTAHQHAIFTGFKHAQNIKDMALCCD
jgi:hypothetical protein